MKTSIEIDKTKFEQAKKLGHSSTLREIVDKALEAYIAELRRDQMLGLLETNFFDGDLNKMRKKDTSSR